MSTNRAQDIQSYIEKKREERLKKAQERLNKIRELKLRQSNGPSVYRPVLQTKSITKRPSTAPVIRQTKTSQKRIDIANFNLPEYEELKKELGISMVKPNDTFTISNSDLNKDDKTSITHINKPININNPVVQKLAKSEVSLNIINNVTKADSTTTNVIKRTVRKQWRSPKPLTVNMIANDSDLPFEDSDCLTFETCQSKLIDNEVQNCNINTTKVCTTPKPSDLQKRLINWLKKHGKEVDAYKNLHLFGTRKSIAPKSKNTQSNKENINDKDDQNLTPSVKLFDKTFDVDEQNTKIESLLKDLYSLIMDGYPKEHCLEWLLSIKKHYGSIKDFSLFWECKALLDTNNCDFQSAINCYQKAIVVGAEKVDVEQKLCNLFDKMCSLNIDPKKFDKTPKCDGNKFGNRDDFASSIIKLAVSQTRKKKTSQEDETYFVTPVRRSSRIWNKTPTSNTSFRDIHYVSSLNMLDEQVRKCIKFTPNKAL